jgi:hypothetical protein
VEAHLVFRNDVRIWSIAPHAHLRSKSWRIDLIEPEGAARTVLSVPRFDFNWQLSYTFATPLPIRAGTRMLVNGVFDNSAANRANPDPDAEVRWGNMTTDEMLIASVVYSLKDESGRH